MTVWIIITCSLIGLNYDIRKQEYIIGINKVLKTFNDPKYKIVIVENSSKITKNFLFVHKTFLDEFGVPVLYTKNNILLTQTYNYGIIELIDVKECINYFQIGDDDFIVKITGRYELLDECPFFDVVNNLETKTYSAIVRYNQFNHPPSLEKTHICTTGLIGLKCKYLKQIDSLELDDLSSIEIKWAEKINSLPDEEVCILEKIGLWVKPRILTQIIFI